MQDVSDEEQAAMALKLMDNVKQLIVDTVAEDIRNGGLVRVAAAGLVQACLMDVNSGSTMQMSVKRIIREQMDKY